MRTGTYGVNSFTMDFVAPFGGFKARGVGREFGPEGLEAYLEDKTISCPATTSPDRVPSAGVVAIQVPVPRVTDG